VVVAPDRFCTDQTPQLTNQCQLPSLHLQSCHPRDIEFSRDETNRVITAASEPSHRHSIPSHDIPPSSSLTHRTTNRISSPTTARPAKPYPLLLQPSRYSKERARRKETDCCSHLHTTSYTRVACIDTVAAKRAHLYTTSHPSTPTTRQSMNIASSTGLLLSSLPVPFAAPPRPA
jgi:hypothetical protein